MSSQDTLKPVRIGFWGNAGSGKTALLAGYYGYLKAQLDIDPNFDLSYSVITLNSKQALPEIFNLMKNKRNFSEIGNSTVGTYSKHSLAYCFENTTNAALPFEWLDYSGQYWQARDYEDEGIIQARINCLKELCTADVVFLLVDANELLNAQKSNNNTRLKGIIDDFRGQINLLKQTAHIKPSEHKFDEFVIALSKSNLMREQDGGYTAHKFKAELKERVGGALDLLWQEIGAIDEERRYLLLSSCEVEKEDKKRIKSLNSIGLDAIAPLAFFAASARAEKIQRETAQKASDGRGAEYAGYGFAGLAGGVGLAATLGVSATIVAIAPIAGPILAGFGGVAGLVKLLQSRSKKEQEAAADKIAKLHSELKSLRNVLRTSNYYCEE